MDSRTCRFLEARSARNAVSKNRVGDAADASRPSDGWLFAQTLLGKPVPDPSARERAAIAQRELREFVFVDAISPPQYGKRAAAGPSDDARLFAKALRGEPVITKEQVREFVAAISTVHEGTYDPAKHPKGGYPKNRGWWSPTGVSGATQVLPSETGQAPAKSDRIDRAIQLLHKMANKETQPQTPDSNATARARSGDTVRASFHAAGEVPDILNPASKNSVSRSFLGGPPPWRLEEGRGYH